MFKQYGQETRLFKGEQVTMTNNDQEKVLKEFDNKFPQYNMKDVINGKQSNA